MGICKECAYYRRGSCILNRDNGLVHVYSCASFILDLKTLEELAEDDNCANCIFNVEHVAGVSFRVCSKLEHFSGLHESVHKIIDDEFFCAFHKNTSDVE